MRRLVLSLFLPIIVFSCSYITPLDIKILTNKKVIVLDNYSTKDYTNLKVFIEPKAGSGDISYVYIIRHFKSGEVLEIKKRDFTNSLGESFPYGEEIFYIRIEAKEGRSEYKYE